MTTGIYSDILEKFREEGRLRRFPTGAEGLIDLSTNDYMGLETLSDEWTKEFFKTSAASSFSSSASRLLASHQEAYASLEALLAVEYGREVLLFNSGYHANTGLVPAVAFSDKVLILSDKLNHASMIDGIRLSKGETVRFRHNDVQHVERILEQKASDYEVVWLLTESVFSMDGDEAPLREFVALKSRYPNLMLYVDEAHAFGVRGERGLGVCEELDIVKDIDIIVGTFGKAAYSVGAFCVCSEMMKQYLVNTARALIFSTALPPVNVAWSEFVVRRLFGMSERRGHLKKISALFREGLERITGEKSVSVSQIVPLMVGSAERAVRLSALLRDRGVNALAIRRPTVPPGTERIRFSLNAALTEKDIEKILGDVEDSLRKL